MGSLSGALEWGFLKCAPPSRDVSIFWELIKANLGVPPQTYWIRNSDVCSSNLQLKKKKKPSMEKAIATHSSTLAWKIPWTEGSGGLQSMGSLRTRLSDFTFTFHFHALEKEMATHSSVLAWRIPGMEEPGGLPSVGSHRVGHDWSNLAAAAAATLGCFRGPLRPPKERY